MEGRQSRLLSLGIEGLRHRGGVLHVSANSPLGTVLGTNSPTRSLSDDPSSTPRPSHRPHGNLRNQAKLITKTRDICRNGIHRPFPSLPQSVTKEVSPLICFKPLWVAVISAKNNKRQRRKRQSVTTKRGKSQTPKVLTAILTLPNLT